ncbi:Uncharacterized protein AC505_1065 [Pseudomonas syringae pv. maculicola]|nr:Uncharacterized protein AC505_1065 [Pseudomonas syringae pv. maculicola]RMU99264.1 hypothetical protein ALP19_101536 [Pseudomonas syringae pv. tomato]
MKILEQVKKKRRSVNLTPKVIRVAPDNSDRYPQRTFDAAHDTSGTLSNGQIGK